MSTKRLFIPITKVDAVNGIVYGVAASETPDRAGEVFDYAGSKPHFEKWSADINKATAGKSFGNLRSMHGSVAAGKLNEIGFNDDDKQIEIAAKVVDPVELDKVLEGVYTGFSIGGKYEKRWKDGDLQRYIASPHEISLVDLPCIPDATFEVVKGAETELRKFHVPTVEAKEPTNDEVAAKARELAKVAGDETKWLDHLDAARKALAANPADLEPQHVMDLAVKAVDDPSVGKSAGGDDLGAEQVWTHKDLPGQTFAKKADLRDALVEKAASDKAASLSKGVTDALGNVVAALDEKDPAGAKKAMDGSDGKGSAGGDADGDKPTATGKGKSKAKDDKTKAKDEADKSTPMKSAADVMARAKICAAEKVPSFVEKRAIIQAARDLNCVAVLPEGFAELPDDNLAKGATVAPDLAKAANVYSVSRLIDVLGSIDCLIAQFGGEGVGYYYSDTGTRIDVSDATMTSLRTAAQDLGSIAAALLDEVLSAMGGDDAEKAVGRGTVLGDLRKIGARNSASDKTRLRKAHDLLAEIEPDMCGADKHVDEGDLKKQLAATENAFTKSLSGISDVLADVADRVKRIEAQPVAGRPTSLRAVDKFAGEGNGERFTGGENPAVANHEAFVMMTGERERLGLPQR